MTGIRPPARRLRLPSTSLLKALALGGLLAASTALPAWATLVDESATSFEMSEEHMATVLRIIEEGKERNEVMEHLRYLTQEIGPRLTGSDRLHEANEWTKSRFEDWGLENTHLWEWGTISVKFNRGPSTARIVEPIEREMEFSSRAWSAGTNGPLRGPVVHEPETEEELEAMRDQLDGAWVLRRAARRGSRRGVVDPGGAQPTDLLDELYAAGIAGLITASRDERVHTGGARGWRELDPDNLPDEVAVRVRRSDYDSINSRLADDEEVVVEFDMQHEFVPGPIACYNTVAEIPGTEIPEEVVIVSAHLDSWDGPGSQGTVDNGTGSAVTLEAARILMAANAKPKRTIRFILWTGEEQGLLGSRAYVDSLSDEERARISAVFVDDGGTNYEGGLQCIEEMAPMLSWATQPVNFAFPDMPVKIHTRDEMPRGGGSDHASFNRAGVPGFFWDEVGRANYGYAWHTQNDKYDQAIPEYLVQSSTCTAITAFNLANAPTLLPRRAEAEESSDDDSENDSDESDG
ncbi:MAG: M28 family metallopeptidase [Phycisphaerales bacterium]